ncbi:MAG: hypothetical protein A3K19_28150 [Lentisphaerae bacterium RIFOXYB12_FULL_65_16]|nr:MAG: hypothetical protein A3K18_34290 [Lentisphaerae bacterium RIFOXYA12_64_32]OGV85464.1 MAG: hypothetical protein A3K19_28150 [Lentisphaerae bacterium RIFOXYB12_FULL_65_16]
MFPLAGIPTGVVVYAFQQSDTVGRGIVVLLFLVSMYVWIIIIEKGTMVGRARRGSRHFLRMFDRTVSPLDLALQIEQFHGPMARIYAAGVEEVMDVLEVDPNLVEQHCRRRTLPRALSPYEIDKIRSTLEHAVAAEITALESRLGLLGTAVTLSPFLGLLGTVWGILAVFVGIAQQGRMEIVAIAPGISGALLTTVAGLTVAIPAVIGFNLIGSSIRQTTVDMDNFVEDFLARLKLQTGQEEGTAAGDTPRR